MPVYLGLLLVYKSRLLGRLVAVVTRGKEATLFNLGFINTKSNSLLNSGSGLPVYHTNLSFPLKSVLHSS